MNYEDMANPLISIIIVVFNGKDTVGSAIESVVGQEGSYELLIIDGASTDGTLEIIKSYQSQITFWISEPDNGIYDAMNKGVVHSTGKWIYFLGSDDVLTTNIISQVQQTLINSEDVLIYGDVKYEGGGFFKSQFSFLTLIQNTIHHQAAFYKRTLFDNFKYDDTLKIISDYELNLFIYLNKFQYKKIDLFIAKCSKEGRSRNPILSYNETNVIRKKYVNGLYEFNLHFLLSVKYVIMSLYRISKKSFR